MRAEPITRTKVKGAGRLKYISPASKVGCSGIGADRARARNRAVVETQDALPLLKNRAKHAVDGPGESAGGARGLVDGERGVAQLQRANAGNGRDGFALSIEIKHRQRSEAGSGHDYFGGVRDLIGASKTRGSAGMHFEIAGERVRAGGLGQVSPSHL